MPRRPAQPPRAAEARPVYPAALRLVQALARAQARRDHAEAVARRGGTREGEER